MATTELTVGALGDLPNGIRIADLTTKLREDWSDDTITITVTGSSSGKPGVGNRVTGGTLAIHSASAPSAGEMTTLKSWCGSHTPDDGKDSVYTDCQRADAVAEGSFAVGTKSGTAYPIVQVGGAWVELVSGAALVADYGGYLLKKKNMWHYVTESTFTGSSQTWATVTSTSVSPDAGSYKLTFNGEAGPNENAGGDAEWVDLRLALDGVAVVGSVRRFYIDDVFGGITSATIIIPEVEVTSGDAITLEYRTASGDAMTLKHRCLMAEPILMFDESF
jgi:hypothetical protein